MTLAELLAKIRAAAGKPVEIGGDGLYATWSAGDGSATLEAAADPGDGKPALPNFTLRAYNGGFLDIGWGAPVVVDLAGIKISEKSRPILKDHHTNEVVGHSTAVANNGRNIVAKGVVSGTGEAAKEVVGNARNGFPWQASIGCRVLKAQYVDEKGKIECNGRTFKGPLVYVPASNLQEISFVALGGDDSTSALVARANLTNQKEHTMDKQFEAWLKARGIDHTKQTAEQIAALEAAWKAEPAPTKTTEAAPTTGKPVVQAAATDADDTDPLTARREREAAEVERIAAIREKTTGHPKIEAQAIREGWSAEKAELTAMRASRPAPVNGNTGAGAAASTPQVLEAAACMSLGMRGERLEKDFDERTLEAASRMRGFALSDLLLAAAAANGYTVRPGCYRSDLRGVLQAAFSSSDIGGILSNIANKSIVESFMAVEQTWRQVASITPANDFKTMTSYRLTGNLQFEKVGSTGGIKSGDLGNDAFTNKVDTHAKLLSIPRTDLVNDNLGALQKTPALLGRGAALQLNEVFWTEFLADAGTFYTLARGNYQEGAGTVLSVDSLTAAELLFMNQTDSNGKPLGITPKFLLVPNALNAAASALMRSLELRDTTANTKIGTSNPHAGKFEVVRSSYLNNSKVAGGSATAWSLIADPRELSVIEVAFLNGQEQPTIESSDADFSELGIQLRGYFDFGVKKQEYRAAVKSKGAA
jgi:hypothetical protein